MSWCCNKSIPTCYQHQPYMVINVPYQTTSSCWGCQIWQKLGQLIWSFLDGHVKVFHWWVQAKDFPIPSQVYFNNWFVLWNIYNSQIRTNVHICWRMSHHWGILGQLFWLDGNKLGLRSASQCRWMLLQLVQELINSNGCWTNLTPSKVIQQAYEPIPRSPTCLVDDILDPRSHSCVVCHDDWLPLVMVNRVGLPRVALPTFLSFPHSHAFKNGGPRMIWDPHSSNMEEPNVDEKEHAMGFCTGTTVVQCIFKRIHRKILGQVMDLNCFTWIFSLVLVKQLHFGQSHPPTPPHLHLLHLLLG